MLPDPIWPPTRDHAYAAAVARVLYHGPLTEGPETMALAGEFEKYLGEGVSVLPVSSGTAALELSLAACGIGPGDEVLVPAFGFTATAMAPLRVGATPRFVDIDETFNMDPELAAHAITERTCAILVCHLHGRPAKMAEFMALAEEHDLRLIEDACAAPGARIGPRQVGTFGDVAAFSLNRTKMLAGGQGGILVTPHDSVLRRAWALARWGESPTPIDGPRRSYLVGTNAKTDELTCAIARVSLQRLSANVARSLLVAEALRDGLKLDVPGSPYALAATTDDEIPSWHKLRVWGDGFRLRRAGIPLSTSEVRPLIDHPVFREDAEHGYYPVARATATLTTVVGSHERPLWTLDPDDIRERAAEALERKGAWA